MSRLISLGEWASKNGIDPATARQRAGRGAFETAQKIGRNWVIDEEEKLIDHRRKDMEKRTYFVADNNGNVAGHDMDRITAEQCLAAQIKEEPDAGWEILDSEEE